MNCPSRTDDAIFRPGWNQSPPALAADSTTLADLNGIANLREQPHSPSDRHKTADHDQIEVPDFSDPTRKLSNCHSRFQPSVQSKVTIEKRPLNRFKAATRNWEFSNGRLTRTLKRIRHVVSRYIQFVGPGMLISVAYIDPGNYATDVGAGTETRFSLLFIVLLSNLFAIFLQALCIKLGSVTGKNLAESC